MKLKKVDIRLKKPHVVDGSVFGAGHLFRAGRKVAARLVNSGIAEYVQAAEKKQPTKSKSAPEK